MSFLFVSFFLSVLCIPSGSSLKLKSMLLKVRLMLCFSGPLMASLNAVMDADAGCLLILYALPLGRGIVSLDCGLKVTSRGLKLQFSNKSK